MRSNFIVATLVLSMLFLSSCGSGAPTPIAQPVPIEFNKASTAVDISDLVNVMSQTVDVGTEVCSAVRSAFVTQMNYLTGLTVEGGETVTQAAADISGNTVNIDFSAWGGYGCSGNSGVFPVCYRAYVNGIRMFAGHIDTAPTAASSAGESGTMWIEFDPNGTALSSSIGQTLFMKAVYDLSDANNPSIVIDSSGDIDGIAGALADMTVRCVMSKEDALGAMPFTLLEMNREGAVLYVAQTDGSETSVKVDGGGQDTGGATLCVDDQGAASTGCALVDVAGVEYPSAASDYIVPGSDFPVSSEITCLTDDDFSTDTLGFTSPSDTIGRCWSYMSLGAEFNATSYTVVDGVMRYDNPVGIANSSVIFKNFDATSFNVFMVITEASQTTGGDCKVGAFKMSADGTSLAAAVGIGYRSARSGNFDVCSMKTEPGDVSYDVPSCVTPPSPSSPVTLRLIWDGTNITGWYEQNATINQIGPAVALALGEYYKIGIICDGEVFTMDISEFGVDATAIGQE